MTYNRMTICVMTLNKMTVRVGWFLAACNLSARQLVQLTGSRNIMKYTP